MADSQLIKKELSMCLCIHQGTLLTVLISDLSTLSGSYGLRDYGP
jgi:hypothetical protein